MDTSERLDNDGAASEETGLESSVLTGRTLAVVFITNDDPRDARVTVVSGDGGNSSVLAGELVEDLVGLTVVGVDCADQTVLRNVLEVSTVLEPWATSGDVVGGALALGLDEDGGVDNVLAVPRLEGSEELETVRLGVDLDLDLGAVSGRGLVDLGTLVVALGGELETLGRRELEVLAVGVLERVGEGVEGEGAGNDESGDNVGGGNESVGGGVGVVTGGLCVSGRPSSTQGRQ